MNLLTFFTFTVLTYKLLVVLKEKKNKTPQYLMLFHWQFFALALIYNDFFGYIYI